MATKIKPSCERIEMRYVTEDGRMFNLEAVSDEHGIGIEIYDREGNQTSLTVDEAREYARHINAIAKRAEEMSDLYEKEKKEGE